MKSEFRNSFTGSQKAAVINLLLLFAVAHKGLHQDETAYIEQVRDILDVGYESPEMINFKGKTFPDLMAILNSLSVTNKEWVIISLYGITHISNRLGKIEWPTFFKIIKGMGVEEQDFENILMRAKATHQILTLVMRSH